MSAGERQQVGGIARDRRVRGDLQRRELSILRHHRVEHHELALVVDQRAHGRVDHARARRGALLRRGVHPENRVGAVELAPGGYELRERCAHGCSGGVASGALEHAKPDGWKCGRRVRTSRQGVDGKERAGSRRDATAHRNIPDSRFRVFPQASCASPTSATPDGKSPTASPCDRPPFAHQMRQPFALELEQMRQQRAQREGMERDRRVGVRVQHELPHRGR